MNIYLIISILFFISLIIGNYFLIFNDFHLTKKEKALLLIFLLIIYFAYGASSYISNIEITLVVSLVTYLAIKIPVKIYEKKQSKFYPFVGGYSEIFNGIMWVFVSILGKSDFASTYEIETLIRSSYYSFYNLDIQGYTLLTILDFTLTFSMVFILLFFAIKTILAFISMNNLKISTYSEYKKLQSSLKKSNNKQILLVITILSLLSLILIYEVDLSFMNQNGQDGEIKFSKTLELYRYTLTATLIPLILAQYINKDKGIIADNEINQTQIKEDFKKGDIMNINDFEKRFKEIKKMGWVQSHRKGTTGIGKTLEDLLGINENNISGPDFDRYELKSSRKDDKSYLTLITQSPMPRGFMRELRDTYGYSQTKNNKTINCLRSTLVHGKETYYTNDNIKRKIKFLIEDYIDDGKKIKAIRLYIDGVKLDGYWSIPSLVSIMRKKLKNIVYVVADTKIIEGNEHFRFEEAFLLTSKNITEESVVNAFESGKILLDIRLGQYKNGNPHDHGTAFRIYKNELDELYDVETI